jgi:hypothetical protein
MAWDRNDWIAAALIGFLALISLIVAALLLGYMPSVDEFFRFTGEPEKTAFTGTSLGFYVLE